MSKFIRVREKDPDPWIAYQIPDDLSVPDEWRERTWRHPKRPDEQVCLFNFDGIACGGAGSWITQDDEGRFDIYTDEQFTMWLEPVEDSE